MNTSITYSDLPPIEREVADLYVWGLTKKEIALKRNRSIRTIENQIRELFRKTNVRKDTEFASWYFCTRFNISFNLSPIKRAIISYSLLLLFSVNLLHECDFFRVSRVRGNRIERVERARRKNEA